MGGEWDGWKRTGLGLPNEVDTDALPQPGIELGAPRSWKEGRRWKKGRLESDLKMQKDQTRKKESNEG